jgi:MOSC domain-containing protein YiiM
MPTADAPATVLTVQAGRIRPASWAGRPQRTAIDKPAVTGPVAVRALGLDGDEVGDPRFHGGPHKAVYAFASEDLAFWSGELGRAVPHGMFGENLTTAGIDLNQAVLGERWRIGTALLSPSEIRTPCRTFATWLGRQGYDNRLWARRFTAQGRHGCYLTVLEEGTLRAGDDIHVEHRPGHGVTVATMFAAYTTDRTLLPRLLEVEGLPARVYADARRAAAARPAREAAR